MAARSDLSFEEFIEFQFGRAVRAHGNPWYFDPDHDWWEPERRTGIAYLTCLLSNGPQDLEWFSDEQIAQGTGGASSRRPYSERVGHSGGGDPLAGAAAIVDDR